MRILTCKPGHTLQIDLPQRQPDDLPARHLFEQGPIEIFIGHVREHEIKIAISCDPRMTVTQQPEGR